MGLTVGFWFRGTSPIGTITPWLGGYFVNNANGSFTNVLANTVANVNTLLNSSGWYVCDGSAINDVNSPIFNGTSRYLPNLTDSRFLQGSTTAGGIGGSNTLTDHTHTFSLTAAHTHGATTSGGSAHSHGVGTYATASNGAHTHNLKGDYGTLSGNTSGITAVMVSNSQRNTEDYVAPSNGAHTHTISGSSATESSHTHTLTTSSQSTTAVAGTVGAGAASASTENRPKYLSVFFIMKVK